MPTPSTPFIITGTVYDSDSNAESDVRITITTSQGSDTFVNESDGGYVYNLANIGYTNGETVTWSAISKYDNQTASGSFTLTGDNLEFDINLLELDVANYPRGNRDAQIYNVGGKPVSLKNPFPVLITGREINGFSPLDRVSHSLVTIPLSHYRIHSGNHYFIKNYTTLDSAGTTDFCIKTPSDNTEVHLLFVVNSTAQTTIDVYEDSDFDLDGTPVTPFNNDRNSSNETKLSIFTGCTVNGDGTKISSAKFGTGANATNSDLGSTEREDEIILKTDTKYIFRFTSGTNGNIIDYRALWYEVTPKN